MSLEERSLSPGAHKHTAYIPTVTENIPFPEALQKLMFQVGLQAQDLSTLHVLGEVARALERVLYFGVTSPSM